MFFIVNFTEYSPWVFRSYFIGILDEMLYNEFNNSENKHFFLKIRLSHLINLFFIEKKRDNLRAKWQLSN